MARKIKGGKKADLVNFFKVLSWLDKMRWNQVEKHPPFSKGFYDTVVAATDLRPEQKILTHWLLCITNKVKSAVKLWGEDNSSKVKRLVKEYGQCQTSTEVSKLCKRFLRNGQVYSYRDERKSIERTLMILFKEYEGNLVRFMMEELNDEEYEDNSNVNNMCSRLAFRLYLLSYYNSSSTKETMKLLKNYEQELQKNWRDNIISSKRWHKRTWVALRDYVKHRELSKIFIKAIKDNNKSKIWRNYWNNKSGGNLHRLELPGDTWVINFFKDTSIKPIQETVADFNFETGDKGKKASKAARDLWKEVGKSGFSPEQFDVAFDLSQRMCKKGLREFNNEVQHLGKREEICYSEDVCTQDTNILDSRSVS